MSSLFCGATKYPALLSVLEIRKSCMKDHVDMESILISLSYWSIYSLTVGSTFFEKWENFQFRQ